MMRMVALLLMAAVCSSACIARNEVSALREATAVLSGIAGDLIHFENDQTAGGDINDAWSLRMAIAGGPLSVLGYMVFVRPLRDRVLSRGKSVHRARAPP